MTGKITLDSYTIFLEFLNIEDNLIENLRGRIRSTHFTKEVAKLPNLRLGQRNSCNFSRKEIIRDEFLRNNRDTRRNW